jgi:hypothetical protein
MYDVTNVNEVQSRTGRQGEEPSCDSRDEIYVLHADEAALVNPPRQHGIYAEREDTNATEELNLLNVQNFSHSFERRFEWSSRSEQNFCLRIQLPISIIEDNVSDLARELGRLLPHTSVRDICTFLESEWSIVERCPVTSDEAVRGSLH